MVQKFDYLTHTVAWRIVLCTAKPGRVAADAAEILAETAALIAGSNKDLMS